MSLPVALLIHFAAWTWLAWSLLAVIPTPARFFWKPAVAATEWGHWLAGMAAVFAFAALYAGAGPEAVAPALAAALLFVSPSLRAMVGAARVKTEIDRAWNPGAADGRFLRRRAPLVVSDLGHIPIPRAVMTRHIYKDALGARLHLDLYRGTSVPGSGSGPSPAVVVIHGGSWSSGSSAQLPGMNRYLAGIGYAVAALNYRLAPRHPFPAPIEDIAAALEFLKIRASEFGIDSTRMVLLGRSSGGHLALLAAYTLRDPGVRGVVAMYAPTDMSWSWARPAPRRLMDSNAAIAKFLGGGPGEVGETFERASPIRFVRGDLPPTLLIHGGRDELVSPFQSRRLAAALEEAGARYSHVEIPWGRHGMDANLAGPSGQITLYAVERFLAAVCFGRGRVETAPEGPSAVSSFPPGSGPAAWRGTGRSRPGK